nr:MetaGeneMark_Unknown Function [uncultured bacterium]
MAPGKAGRYIIMDLVLGSIAVVVWLLVMVPAAFICFSSSDPASASEIALDNVTQMPRSESRSDETLVAA